MRASDNSMSVGLTKIHFFYLKLILQRLIHWQIATYEEVFNYRCWPITRPGSRATK